MAQGTVGVNILSNTVQLGGSSVSAFGDLITAENTPVIQLDWVYGINTQLGTVTTVNSATGDTSSGRLRLQSGTNIAGSAIYQSTRIARYRAGQGMTARFTAAFTAGAASSTQIVGVGTATNGYFFGFNGTAFGILHRNAGGDNWVAQTAWNQDKCDGTGGSGFNWTKTNGNVMMIRYPYLGYGDIKFYVQNPPDGSWILCHIIQYANSTPTLQLSNPSMAFYAQSVNTGNNTNLIVYVGSVGIFISGMRAYLGPQWGIDSLKNTITTETNILTLKNATTYNGLTNYGLIRLRSISIVSDGGNGVATMRMRKGTTLTGASYTTINGTSVDGGTTITSGNSIASYDTAGSLNVAGTLIFNAYMARNTAYQMDLADYDLFLAPTETLTFSIVSAASASVGVAINWNEDI